MPLVRIDLLQGKPKEYVAAIGESVHRAMVETIGVPARDHFQVLTEHAPGYLVYDSHYLEVNRTDDVVFIQIFLSAGRSREQKQGFFKRVGIPPRQAGAAARGRDDAPSRDFTRRLVLRKRRRAVCDFAQGAVEVMSKCPRHPTRTDQPQVNPDEFQKGECGKGQP